MYHKISADYIYPVASEPVQSGVIVTDEKGKIMEISTREKFDAVELKILNGTIVPGFINTHCHLELSHLRGKCPTGVGLIPFISHVIKNRNVAAEIISDAIATAESEMLACGIVAVGDISNTTDSFPQKQKNNLHYYTFVEYFDLFQEENSEIEFEKYNAVYEQLAETNKNKRSKVPHAPYSVSKKLFKLLSDHHAAIDSGAVTISIHNQETLPENELFQNKQGDFISFYERLNMDTKSIPHLNKSAIHYSLEFMSNNKRNLFVHNTLTTKEDIQNAKEKLKSSKLFWATCPNANLYIENRLPNYQNFIDTNADVTIGTDSLASNWQSNILEEMKTILKYQSYLDFKTVLKWATINGARALGFEDELGSIEIGKQPGLVLIENMGNGNLTNQSVAKRII
ncbi:MAG: amidohydrolase [Bacteroidota bacterium]|nr:amidohydrolase [Bacteroidota bacterium]